MKSKIYIFITTSGIALLFLLISINQTHKYRSSSNGLNSQISKGELLKSENIQVKEKKAGTLYRKLQDGSTLNRILREGGFLEQVNSWNGKLLFVTFNSVKPSPEFRYYSHNSSYEDTNRNGVQDKSDKGFFNPASTVKVSVAALSLEKLNKIGLTRESEYRMTESSNWFRIDEDIRRSLVISDNDATNRLILWLGFDYINHTLESKGLTHLVIDRLMLNQGTLIESPPFEIRLRNKRISQPSKSVSIKATCYETASQVGICATASDLVGVLLRIVQPDYLLAEEKFNLKQDDRQWLQEVMSHTPRKEYFDYPDNYCRFLTQVERKIAGKSGRMLSKCGVALFSNTYVDSSFIETDSGQKYYVVFSVTPPQGISEQEIIKWMNTITNFALLKLP